jgi:hypothetical protein
VVDEVVYAEFGAELVVGTARFEPGRSDELVERLL